MTDISARTMTRVSSQVGLPAADDWYHHAACKDKGAGPWDPAPEREGPRQRQHREEYALEVCNGRPADGERPAVPACPVLAICRSHATEYGIWGGETEADRAGKTLKPDVEPEPAPVLACGNKIGTGAGEMRHHRAGEKSACPACLAGSAKEKAERKERARGDRIRARDYMARIAALDPIEPEPEWITSARLTLLNLEAQRASA